MNVLDALKVECLESYADKVVFELVDIQIRNRSYSKHSERGSMCHCQSVNSSKWKFGQIESGCSQSAPQLQRRFVEIQSIDLADVSTVNE